MFVIGTIMSIGKGKTSKITCEGIQSVLAENRYIKFAAMARGD
jgi:hypothetical protein